ncbi:MAG TPA: lipase family protein [Geminicoccaceae bacterium]|nr:lipase family protein [Geminicoccaceae bacterium]
MSQLSTTLSCRLLCACGCAYYIDPVTGRYAPAPGDRFGPAIGYATTPTPISGGDDGIDACLVGENADGIVVAFRDTLPLSWQSWPTVLDWLQDLFCEPESRPNLPGKVHTGFYDATSSVITEVAATVKSLNPTGTRPVYVTGHSLGGAMAALGAWLLQAASGIKVAQVVTFAAPKPGDGDFQAAYQKAFTNHLRYENYDDLVPLLPPADEFIKLVAEIPLIGELFKQAKSWNYQTVGALSYIENAADGYKVVSDSDGLMAERLGNVVIELGEDIYNENFSSFGNAHSVLCGYGYMSGTCPAAVCQGAQAA